MTTREFIHKNFGVPSNKERSCSSVWADKYGNIYSYGYHYPLLFKVGDLTFLNNVGYSNTTARHISWARGRASIDIWVSGCNPYTYNNPENSQKIPALLRLAHYYGDNNKDVLKSLKKAVMFDLEAELKDINRRIASKKRTDTKVYRYLLAERNDCVDRIASTRPYMK